MTTKLERISELSAKNPDMIFTSVKPAKRIEIPKDNGKMRPLSIYCYEDKLVQEAVRRILEAVYEPHFYNEMFEFRNSRGCHDALKYLNTMLEKQNTNWVLDADIKGFFDYLDHEWIIKFVESRIKDPNVTRLIRRMLKSGIMRDFTFEETAELLKRYTDLFIVQWEDLLKIVSDAVYGGVVLILVCVGVSEYKMDRLSIAVDELCDEGVINGDEIVAQIGYTDYHPRNYRFFNLIGRDEFQNYMNRVDLIITHAGTGSVIPPLKLGKKVTVFPRREMYHEHLDDRQLELRDVFINAGYAIGAENKEELRDRILHAKDFELKQFVSNNTRINQIICISSIDCEVVRMKILMIGNHESVHGGITSVIRQILQYDWDKENVKIQFLPSYKGGNSFQKVICFFSALAEYTKIIRTDTPELIYMHMSHHGSFDRASILQNIAKKHNIPTVIHLHGSEFADFYEECSQKKKVRIRHFFQESGAVITLGERWGKFVNSISPAANVHILRNSVHIPDHIVEQKKSEVNVLFLGVLIKRKGVSDLLQAVNILVHDKNIDDFNLKINIGGTGPEEELLKSYVSENHLEEYVNFLGWVDGDAKEKTLSMNQVFALPSYNEGLPISILEAVSYGMPVIATNVGSVAEAVENERNGFTFEPGNIQGYADALYQLITDYQLRLSMANASRKLAETYYDEKNYFVQLSEVFRSVTLLGKI